MSLLLVCGAVFIGKEGRSSKSPPSVVPSRPPLPRPSSALGGARGVLSPSVAPPPGLALSSLRLRQPDILPSDRQPDTLLWCQAILFLFDSPPLLPLFVRTVISHRLVWCHAASGVRHLRPHLAWCQAIAISALPGVTPLSILVWCQTPPFISVRTVISRHSVWCQAPRRETQKSGMATRPGEKGGRPWFPRPGPRAFPLA